MAQACLEVGAGRRVKEDQIDPSTGVVLRAQVGDEVKKGDSLAVLHHNGSGRDAAMSLLQGTFEIADKPQKVEDLIIERI